MAGKDIAERNLVSQPEVAAELINFYRFDGKPVVQAGDLLLLKTSSPTHINRKLSEENRDILFLWAPIGPSGKRICRAHFGFELQTAQDKYMALRIAGYDGADYHEQYMNFKKQRRSMSSRRKEEDKDSGEHSEEKDDVVKYLGGVEIVPSLCPVYTYVLYFGLTHWNTPKTLRKALTSANPQDASIPNVGSRGFNDLNYPVIEVAFTDPTQIAAMKSDFRYVAPVMVELQKLYAQRGVKIEDLDLTDLMRVLPDWTDPQFPEDVKTFFEALSEDPRNQKCKNGQNAKKHKTASQFIWKVFNRVADELPEGSDCMVAKMFPGQEKKVRGKQFWKDAARWVLAGTDEKVVFKVMDPDGSQRAMYPRPKNFPDCFAPLQPQPATVLIGGGGSKPIGAMSPDAQ